MITRVCTGWSPTGRKQYGDRFLSTFHRFWPTQVELQVYVEEPHAMPRGACRDLWAIPGAAEFADRHRDNLASNGREPRKGWKAREVQNGYSFKFDAYKFFKQIVIPQAAAEGLEDGDILAWLDGDTVTTAPIPAGFLDSQLDGREVCYLNRTNQHSEIGFWAVRINPRTREFLTRLAAMYTSDEFLCLGEWHSAFIWDFVRERITMPEHRLVRPGLRGHVWPTTQLARYLRHDKGPRKGATHG